ncbi:kinase-like domain-containing protein [Pisolithus albus]|nr:kinase-like domain-containing protein [Pisolithus albus]
MSYITHELKQLAGLATQIGINLDEVVDRDLTHGYVRGNHAVLFHGALQDTGSRVAIKVLRSGPPDDVAAIKRVLTELYFWSQLNHENVLPILGISTKYDLTVSLVIKWMEGGNVHDFVQDPNVDPRPLLLGIARGLQYLHECQPNPIIHGDLKGPNVLISEQGEPLLTDYGLPPLLSGSFSVSVSVQSLGALNWTAPEILESEEQEVTIPGDIWGFGMTALELFTRQVPFRNLDGFHNIRRRVSAGPPKRPDAECTYARMTDEWWSICLSCWHNVPSSRADASSLVFVMERALVCPLTYRCSSYVIEYLLPGNHAHGMRFAGDGIYGESHSPGG